MTGLEMRLAWLSLVACLTASAGESFSVATFNLENYLLAPVGHRHSKPEPSRVQVRESILAMKPDVLAVQEIGGADALEELRASLKDAGWDYPYHELAAGFDTNIYVAVLSRYPIVARRSHTNENFLLRGRRFRVSRGFAEVDIRVNSSYTFTLIAAHLKSRREIPDADPSDLREQEALILRRIIDARLHARPEANLVIVGDFNDVKDSKSIRILMGRGSRSLADARPAERNGDRRPASEPRLASRSVTWTYHFARDDTYSRVDYILMSPGMAREWNADSTYVLAMAGWGLASDHRPIVAGFAAEER
jgi:endonuclease/exonuclease/phosphatase family metal-dependent hydrolase